MTALEVGLRAARLNATLVAPSGNRSTWHPTGFLICANGFGHLGTIRWSIPAPRRAERPHHVGITPESRYFIGEEGGGRDRARGSARVSGGHGRGAAAGNHPPRDQSFLFSLGNHL